ncbi:MAG: Mov34/MPN/PAD-1 family protein [Christiangramia sp.]
MKLYNKHKQVELVIDQKLLDKIGKRGIENFPNEFGGFLIGKYSDDYKTLFITDYILPKISKGSRYIFERSSKGIKSILSELFRVKKEFYVGEWHTHPNGSTGYSNTDLNAMINIAGTSSVKIKNPVLLILSVSDKKLNQASFYIYDNKKLSPYE